MVSPVALRGRAVGLAPPFMLALLYGAVAMIGAGLLMTPWAQARPFGWGDAAFTAVSAVTVTGLVVLDAGADLTRFGQAVLLVLFQVGGLGLMTFAVLLLSTLGLPVGLAGRLYLRGDLGQMSLSNLVRLVWVLLRFSLAAQALGFLALLAAFAPAFGPAEGAWMALFYAASAFNNAGFALAPDSLARWARDPVVNLTLSAMVVAGGLGFAVVADLWRTRGWRGLGLNSKLMLVGAAALLLWTTLAFAVLEWRNPATLGALPDDATRLLASVLQAVMPRSGGFSTVDIGATHESTALMTVTLMLIGGGPTSTAGGIKVTTFVVMLMATVAFFKRRETLQAFGRSLGPQELLKVLALTMIAMLTVLASTFALLATQDLPFIDLLFEVASAFGTVGLSRGATGELDAFGRGLIAVLMFAGRVGPLTLGYFLATRAATRVRYPSAQVYLG